MKFTSRVFTIRNLIIYHIIKYHLFIHVLEISIKGLMMRILKELDELKKLTTNAHGLVSFETLDTISYKNQKWPIYAISIGSKDPKAPTLALFGGVHGLEKIGSQVIIAFLKTIIGQLRWDQNLRDLLKNNRIISIPIINPVGMAYHKRSNGNGVDLMRNSPIELQDGAKAIPLASGHRISNKLPWYRGKEGADLEKEILIVIEYAKKNIFPSLFCISIDFHSGIGLKDRLWYPFANTPKSFPRQNNVDNLVNLFNETIPYHIYKIEPQSQAYSIAGDLWDYLFSLHTRDKKFQNNIFIPWTLEMGSWIWVKKNPIQIFSKKGIYNPIKQHRFNRAMRRHFLMIEFFFKAIRNPEAWK